MSRRPVNAGLFTGWYTDLSGKKIRRIPRGDYPELYRLHRKHTGIRLGITQLGMKAPWHG